MQAQNRGEGNLQPLIWSNEGEVILRGRRVPEYVGLVVSVAAALADKTEKKNRILQ